MNPLSKPGQEDAAQLLAEARFNYAQIAEKVGVDLKTLHNWRKNERFAARVTEIQTEMNEAAMKRALARKEYRIGTLADRHNKLLQVLEERAKDPAMQAVPGGNTGFIARKIIASSGELMGYEYAVDTGTLKELRDIEQQVAKELGQIVDKRELTGKDGGPLQHEHSAERMTNEQIDAELRKVFGPVIGSSTAESGGEV